MARYLKPQQGGAGLFLIGNFVMVDSPRFPKSSGIDPKKALKKLAFLMFLLGYFSFDISHSWAYTVLPSWQTLVEYFFKEVWVFSLLWVVAEIAIRER